jgi:hypothetical protein
MPSLLLPFALYGQLPLYSCLQISEPGLEFTL